MKRISVAIPYHGDRLKWTANSIAACHNYSFIKEIVITCEPGSNTRDMCKVLGKYKKVKIFVNSTNLFVFRNKINAVKHCSSDWVALIDSDNVVGPHYFGPPMSSDANKSIILCPCMGKPKLDYSAFVGIDINLKTAGKFVGNNLFDMLINTMNYIFHRETWLSALSEAIMSEYDPRTADSAWMNFHCMKNGMVLRVIDGMWYQHTVHAGSTYRLFPEEGHNEYTKIVKMIKEISGENADSSESIRSTSEKGLSVDSNWSATGRLGSSVLRTVKVPDKSDLLTD